MSLDADSLDELTTEELEALAEMVDDDGSRTVETLREVADFFGIAYQTAKQWRVGDDPMPGEPGRFDLREIFHWIEARRQTSTAADLLQSAQLRLTTARADQAEHDLRDVQKSLVETKAIEEWCTEVRRIIGESLAELPVELVSLAMASQISGETLDFIGNESQRQVLATVEMLQRKLTVENLRESINGESDLEA